MNNRKTLIIAGGVLLFLIVVFQILSSVLSGDNVKIDTDLGDSNFLTIFDNDGKQVFAKTGKSNYATSLEPGDYHLLAAANEQKNDQLAPGDASLSFTVLEDENKDIKIQNNSPEDPQLFDVSGTENPISNLQVSDDGLVYINNGFIYSQGSQGAEPKIIPQNWHSSIAGGQSGANSDQFRPVIVNDVCVLSDGAILAWVRNEDLQVVTENSSRPTGTVGQVFSFECSNGVLVANNSQLIKNLDEGFSKINSDLLSKTPSTNTHSTDILFYNSIGTSNSEHQHGGDIDHSEEESFADNLVLQTRELKTKNNFFIDQQIDAATFVDDSIYIATGNRIERYQNESRVLSDFYMGTGNVLGMIGLQDSFISIADQEIWSFDKDNRSGLLLANTAQGGFNPDSVQVKNDILYYSVTNLDNSTDIYSVDL